MNRGRGWIGLRLTTACVTLALPAKRASLSSDYEHAEHLLRAGFERKPLSLADSQAGGDCLQHTLTSGQRDAVADRSSHLDSATFAQLRTFSMFVGYSSSGHTLVGALLDAHPNIVMAHEHGSLREYRSLRAASTGRQLTSGEGASRRTALFTSLVRNSVTCAVYGRMQSGFNYSFGGALPWQGRWCAASQTDDQGVCEGRGLLAIGDKKGGQTAEDLMALNGTAQVLARTHTHARRSKLLEAVARLCTWIHHLHPTHLLLQISLLLDMAAGLQLPLRLLHVLRNPFDMMAFAC